MVCALVCIVSGGSKGLGYNIGYRRGDLFTYFKDSVFGFSLHELLFTLELEADKIHAGPKRHLCS